MRKRNKGLEWKYSVALLDLKGGLADILGYRANFRVVGEPQMVTTTKGSRKQKQSKWQRRLPRR